MTMPFRPTTIRPTLARRPLLLLGLLGLASRAARAHEPPDHLASIVQPLLPGVVNISVWGPSDAETPRDARGARPDRAHFFGSGFIIDPSGIIVTNKHVIANAYQISVHFNDGSRARARLLAPGGAVDLAVLKVDVPEPLQALTWGDSDHLRIGDTVLAIGNPLGIGLSVSAGIVSALNRNINDSPYDDYIQTDAAINHGNSGGPLVDLDGHVVGVDTSLVAMANGGSIGLGFAITSNDAKFVVDRLLKFGEVKAGWIGIALQDVTPDVVASFGLPWNRGAIVANVDAGSPAAKADMQNGDIIRTVDGRTFNDSRALMRIIGKTMIGSTITLQLWRAGEQYTVTLAVAGYPDDRTAVAPKATKAVAMRPDLPDFGMRLTPLTPELRSHYRLGQQQSGLLVTAVTANSVASQHGVSPGDVVIRVQDTDVSTTAKFGEALSQAQASGRHYIELLVRAGDDQRWLGFQLPHPPMD
jgi:serine protease Do